MTQMYEAQLHSVEFRVIGENVNLFLQFRNPVLGYDPLTKDVFIAREQIGRTPINFGDRLSKTLTRLCEIADVEEFAKIDGRPVRVEIEPGFRRNRINGVGHILKNDWIFTN